ncbi:hypothetical protein DL89DRAFT_110420 [Linderina pennispora]|uniref:Uncharacterized protein n=1 Tax=Linderina pennispora TaxID=61395 RepID=A0A1Y1WF96_9FUNG|nr:uncharacterized protein DL89DRAFT_110420 [Linderina pennispora]ORX72231.1 hypothetical protein DL89DRAFT_110420 [Linderina pennispora]
MRLPATAMLAPSVPAGQSAAPESLRDRLAWPYATGSRRLSAASPASHVRQRLAAHRKQRSRLGLDTAPWSDCHSAIALPRMRTLAQPDARYSACPGALAHARVFAVAGRGSNACSRHVLVDQPHNSRNSRHMQLVISKHLQQASPARHRQSRPPAGQKASHAAVSRRLDAQAQTTSASMMERDRRVMEMDTGECCFLSIRHLHHHHRAFSTHNPRNPRSCPALPMAPVHRT